MPGQSFDCISGQQMFVQQNHAKPMKNDLPIKLRRLREWHGYSQEYVAFRLGITQAAYSKKETGKTVPSLMRLEQIARLYGITMTSLLETDTARLLGQLARCASRKIAETNAV